MLPYGLTSPPELIDAPPYGLVPPPKPPTQDAVKDALPIEKGVGTEGHQSSIACSGRADKVWFGSCSSQSSLGCAAHDGFVLQTKPTAATVRRMKVVELREQLGELGLDTSGKKPELLERLLEAL